MTPPETALVETSTGPVACAVRGGAGPVLVLLPSGAHDHHDFDALCALLPDRYRTVAVDWPGHGGSPLGSAPASVSRFADVAEDVVAQLAPEGAVLVGNSVGGFAATRMAIRRPELVRGLVIVDGGGFAGRPWHVRVFCALMARPQFLRAIYPRFAASYMRARTGADRAALATGIATTRRDPGLRAVAQLWHSFAGPEHDLRAGAPAITAPTLVVWGRHDPVIPLAVGRRIAATIPDATLHVLDTGHVPHTTEAQAVADLLVPFVEAAVRPRVDRPAAGVSAASPPPRRRTRR